MANTISVDKERCIGCTSCVPVCPVTCISMADRPKEEGSKWRKLAVIDVDKCVFCGACVEVCNNLGEKSKNKVIFHAINMVKEVSGAGVDTGLYKDVWCFAEIRHGKIVPTIYELLHVGQRLAGDLNEKLAAVLIGHNVSRYAQDMIDSGADKVYVVDDPMFANFVDELNANALRDIILKEKPNKLLMPASVVGRSVSSRIAIMANTGITADATELSIDKKTGMLHATRPSFGGNLMATILCEKHRPEMATVRPMAFPRAEKISGRKGEIVSIKLDTSRWNVRTKFLQYIPEKEELQDISSSEFIVSGGRGVGGSGGFEPLAELAKLFNGSVGASRAAVDAGWISYRHQVGLTGRTVRPKVYLACGISGQIQHLAGMSSSDVIVAINRDPEAPMMKLANFSIEGDLFEIVPALVNEMKRLRQ